MKFSRSLLDRRFNAASDAHAYARRELLNVAIDPKFYLIASLNPD
jgi:hypothetical protein